MLTRTIRQNKAGHITDEVYTRIRPVGATGTATHVLGAESTKQEVEIRPLLSMTNAPQRWTREMARRVTQT